jgi:hypothetical protein
MKAGKIREQVNKTNRIIRKGSCALCGSRSWGRKKRKKRQPVSCINWKEKITA